MTLPGSRARRAPVAHLRTAPRSARVAHVRMRPRRAVWRVVSAALLAAALGAGVPSTGAAQAGGVFEEGVDRFRAGDYPEAQRLLREYVELAGEQGGEAAANLGEAYHYLGLMTPDAKLAEGYFLAVAERYPTSPLADESVARLARLYAGLGDYEEARRQWQALASSYPFSRYRPEASLRIGETHFAEGNWTAAYDAFSAGFARMKDYQRQGGQGANLRDLEGEYVYWLGRTLLAREANEDARKYLNLLVLDYPGHALEPLALYYLAESYRGGGGDEGQAGDAWRRFSESVRNTSLESVAESPNLPAVARARESGALDRPGGQPRAGARQPAGDEARQPRGDEARQPRGDDARGETPADEPRDDVAAGETVDEDEERVQPEPGPIADRAAPARGEEADEGDQAEEGEEPALRAPEPGRAGGVADGGRAADGEPAADGERALRGAVAPPAPAPRAATPEPAAAPPLPPAPPAAPPPAPDVAETAPAAPPGPVPAPEAAPRALEPIEPGTVFLQVGAFTRAQSASGLSTELRRKGFEPSIATGLVDREGYYRVRIGPFEVPGDRTRLEEVRSALVAAGYGPVITRPEPGP